MLEGENPRSPTEIGETQSRRYKLIIEPGDTTHAVVTVERAKEILGEDFLGAEAVWNMEDKL